jgi:hypothetical protein
MAIQTDAVRVPLEEVNVCRMVFDTTEAVAASTTALMAARAATAPCSLTLIAASSDNDKLTITFPATSANTPVGVLTVTLVAASEGSLAVTASDSTGLITIALDPSVAANNTAAKITTALNGVTPANGAAGIVKGIDVSGVICAAVGSWDSEAVAPKATGQSGVAFAGGAGETIIPDETVLFHQPPCARTITATAAGTQNDTGAVAVVVTGTNINDEVITETLPAFVENQSATKTGTKAFKTITSVFLPSHDGTGATVSLGYSDALGVPFMFSKKPYLRATLNGVIEANPPVTTIDADEIEKNTVDLNSSLNGTEVCLYWLLPEA